MYSYHKQEEQKNRNEKIRLHPVEAETKTQTRKMVLKHGGAPLATQSGLGRRPEQFPVIPVDASGRGDNRRQEGVTQTVGLVPLAIFVDLLLSSLQKLVVDVLMAQGDVVGVISTAVELTGSPD